MTQILAAAGAALVAVLEVTLWPLVDVEGAHPHLVFVGAVAWAFLGSLDGAIAWGFTGGLMLDVLGPRPLGATALTLLLVVAASAAIGRAFTQLRVRMLAPLVTTLPIAIGFTLLVTVIEGAADRASFGSQVVPALVPGAVLDTVLATIIVAVVTVRRRRRDEQQRIGW
jgi:rod shape-determining protein MreD